MYESFLHWTKSRGMTSRIRGWGRAFCEDNTKNVTSVKVFSKTLRDSIGRLIIDILYGLILLILHEFDVSKLNS